MLTPYSLLRPARFSRRTARSELSYQHGNRHRGIRLHRQAVRFWWRAFRAFVVLLFSGTACSTTTSTGTARSGTTSQVEEISKQFQVLNPYDRDAVPTSVLKIEDDNYEPERKKPRQLYCLGISAKRYTLFIRHEKNSPVLLRKGLNNEEDRWSEHGLGHLLNPSDPESEDRDWIAQAWFNIGS